MRGRCPRGPGDANRDRVGDRGDLDVRDANLRQVHRTFSAGDFSLTIAWTRGLLILARSRPKSLAAPSPQPLWQSLRVRLLRPLEQLEDDALLTIQASRSAVVGR